MTEAYNRDPDAYPAETDEPYICGNCGRAYWTSTGTGVCSGCSNEYELGKTIARESREIRETLGEDAAREYEETVESRNPDPAV